MEHFIQWVEGLTERMIVELLAEGERIDGTNVYGTLFEVG